MKPSVFQYTQLFVNIAMMLTILAGYGVALYVVDNLDVSMSMDDNSVESLRIQFEEDHAVEVAKLEKDIEFLQYVLDECEMVVAEWMSY